MNFPKIIVDNDYTQKASLNNKRIAKNTMLLYFRMLFMMTVSLYTSRVVLSTLGVEDFGIYNVVGGVVTMFSFINSAITSSTQRYLTFELGRGNIRQLQKVFTTSVIIHMLISLLIVVLAEIIGLWFLYNKMTIPTERMDAAFWVFQMSTLTMVVLIMSVPYNATIIAHEKMSIFAYISVLEIVLKLLIVYLLQIGHFDKLKLYVFLIFAVQLLIRLIYGRYCSRHFMESRLKKIWDGKLFKTMLSFAGWNLWGNCAAVTFSQGVNILLNMFFGPMINAARGVAVQVQSAINQFSFNFQTALNPQITKSYAVGDYSYMHNLIYKSSKFTFFLLLMLSMPVMFETDMVLSIWLKEVPDYTVPFLRLMLCVTIIDAVANPLMISAQATGNVKRYQSIVGGVLLAILPISYVSLKLGGSPTSVFVVHLCVCIIAFTVRLFIIRSMIQLSLRGYVRNVIVKCTVVTIVSLLLPLCLQIFIKENIISFVIVCPACVLSVGLTGYSLGLEQSERQFVKQKVVLLYSKIRK